MKKLVVYLQIFFSIACQSSKVQQNNEDHINIPAYRAVIKANLNSFKSCYEELLTRDGGKAEGKIMVHFEVKEVGKPFLVRIHTSEIDDSTFQDCMVKTIKSLIFPAPPTGSVAVVYYPFTFGAQR